ncbi:bacterioferritin [Litorilituus sediminis]|uniref:Bacterioferritin n=1 Tax=Litorilituus sediminis TaxID=718192 RepID=A0A4P6P1Y1_9GAMM|nr:bacterioferritin [Litorilituus sediminis]QBG35366.1 bacterioferritin [Litorilituus sediminis]
MKGSKKVIALLNKALGNELVAINQYFLHARMYRNWGLEELDEADYKVSIKKMKTADDLINRILFLEGLPNLQDLGRLKIGENTVEMMQANMDLEYQSRAVLQELIACCEAEQDYISRECAEKLLEKVEEQIDWIESQQYLINHAGIENYLESMMS